jgi:hypothetical protein
VNPDFNTNSSNGNNLPDKLFQLLTAFTESAAEFLLVRENGAQAALRRDEVEILFQRGNVYLEAPVADGVKNWRIVAAESEGNGLLLKTVGSFGADAERLELIPRVTASDMMESIKLARLEMAGRIAAIIGREDERYKIVSLKLSQGIRAGEYGRYAQIKMQTAPGVQVAIVAPVIERGTNAINFLTSALSWFTRVSRSTKKVRIETLWLVADKGTVGKLKKLLALFRPEWRERISLYALDINKEELREVKIPEMRSLWRAKPRKLTLPAAQLPTESAREIAGQFPEAIDITFSRHGENLSYRGMKFARIREFLGEEKLWFGTERKRKLFSDETRDDLNSLLEDLKAKRSAHNENRTHYLYRTSPEHWLESILRRDITQLDANLILSPIYQQFRASKEQIDLLAVRRDGRLVVIELKVTPNREMVFQAANYWREIELLRRTGALQEARAFGDIEILDEPALVLLVAPALSFHHDLPFWASFVSPKIETYRYDLHENWRESIKVLERRKL